MAENAYITVLVHKKNLQLSKGVKYFDLKEYTLLAILLKITKNDLYFLRIGTRGMSRLIW